MFSKKDLIKYTKGEINESYKIGKSIGEGGFSKVYLVTHKISGETRCLKRITRADIEDLDSLKTELDILAKADNPNIINVYEVFINNTYFDIVMENCRGGSLLNRINELLNQNKCFTEDQASIIIRQIMLALNYAHKNRIVHRDIKLENVLFLDENLDNLHLKIIDFGLSKSFDKELKRMKDKLGTCYYISPEILKENYNEKCDIWATGVLLYILLIGIPPFNSEVEGDDNEIYEKIENYKYSFDNKYGISISDSAKDLIKKMLKPEKERLSAEEVLNHPFVSTKFSKLNTSDSKLSELKIANLKNFVGFSNLQKLVLTSIATRLSYSEIDKLHDIFIELDTNNDGSISYDEFINGIQNFKDVNSKEKLKEIFVSIDTDGSKKINYSEFIAAAMDRKFYEDKDRLLEIFVNFDKDKNGKISFNEFEKILNMKRSENPEEDFYEILRKEFDKYDLNKDGEIDYDEFVHMITNKKNSFIPKKSDKGCCTDCSIF